MEVLEGELLMEIFRKLPLKSVVGCKVVCKRWHSLISEPFFTSNYNPISIRNQPISVLIIPGFNYCSLIRESNNNVPAYIYYETNNVPVKHCISVNFPEPCGGGRGEVVTVLGSWNGLVAFYNNRRGFCLLNPWTKEEKLVLVEETVVVELKGVCLYGLCHDPTRNEYKAVMSHSTGFYVVSFNDGECKSKTHQPRHLLRDLDQGSNSRSFFKGTSRTIFKGVPHWICRHRIDKQESYIVYFDPFTDEFKMVRLPEAFYKPGGVTTPGLGALGGQLMVAFRVPPIRALEVWGLRENSYSSSSSSSSWSKLFAILDYFQLYYPVSLSAWCDDGEVLITEDDHYLGIYNVRNQSYRILPWLYNTHWVQRRMVTPSHTITHKLVTFVPTLVSPNR